jgi:hypothetical protein
LADAGMHSGLCASGVLAAIPQAQDLAGMTTALRDCPKERLISLIAVILASEPRPLPGRVSASQNPSS